MTRKKRAGRPRLHAGQRLSKTRTFRLLGQLDKQLQEAATVAGRSVSEEIAYRLHRSFYDDQMSARFLGSNIAGELLRLIRAAMAIEGIPGEDWGDDPARAESLRTAINVMVAVLANLPVELPSPERRLEGNRTAAHLLASSSMRQKLPRWLSALEQMTAAKAEESGLLF
jgi:hypothetical protein